MSPKITKALDVYIRVSQVGGREGDSFISPRVQEERCRALAKARNYKIGKVFTDLDRSGGTMDRPEFNKARERIKEGESGGMIVARMDRFSRTLKGALETLEEIEAAGGYLIECDGDWDTSTPMGRFGRDLILRLSQLFREQVAESWSVAREKAIERGVHQGGKVPLGYVKDEDGRLRVDPETAPHVAEAFRMRIRGESWPAIYRYLEAVCPGRVGSRRTVWKLIKNRVYVGEVRSGQYVREGAHEAIVGEGEWLAANRNGSQGYTPKGGSEGSLLGGLLRCASCGGKMTGSRTRQRNGTIYRFYRCFNEHCTARATIGAPVVEPYVVEAFLGGLEGLAFGLAGEGEAEIPRLQRRLEDAEHVLEVLLEDPASLASLRAEERARVLGKAAEARDVALAALGEATARQPRMELLETVEIRDFYDGLSISERRELIGSSIEKVIVAPGRGSVKERVTIVERGSEFDQMSDAEFACWTREHAA